MRAGDDDRPAGNRISRGEQPLALGHGFPDIGIAFSGLDEGSQAAPNVGAPTVRADFEAFELGDQADVGEGQLRDRTNRGQVSQFWSDALGIQC